jgi:hypothetical protein
VSGRSAEAHRQNQAIFSEKFQICSKCIANIYLIIYGGPINNIYKTQKWRNSILWCRSLSIFLDWASINNQVYVFYTFWANLGFFRKIGLIPPMSPSRPAKHCLCVSPQLHQTHQFVLRPQPLSKTPSSYFAGGSIWILGLKPLLGASNTFVETIVVSYFCPISQEKYSVFWKIMRKF